MKTIAVIPARLKSTRLPRKLLQDLGGKPVIVRTYENIAKMKIFDQVLIATDSEEIAEVVSSAGAEVIMSRKKHECGSDRIAEAIEDISADLILNVQGDEPFVSAEELKSLIDVFSNDTIYTISLASLMHPIKGDHVLDPNNVKVVIDEENNALYFSRAPIPFLRGDGITEAMKHIGVYAFRRNALLDFYHSEAGRLENIEKIECLRYLERGHKIKMVRVNQPSIGIDTQQDLDRARAKF